MTQQEHLNRIRARCVELLEIAACAGAAESGLKATIVAIDSIFNPPSSQTTHNWIAIYEKETVERIIASWPAELL